MQSPGHDMEEIGCYYDQLNDYTQEDDEGNQDIDSDYGHELFNLHNSNNKVDQPVQ